MRKVISARRSSKAQQNSSATEVHQHPNEISDNDAHMFSLLPAGLPRETYKSKDTTYMSYVWPGIKQSEYGSRIRGDKMALVGVVGRKDEEVLEILPGRSAESAWRNLATNSEELDRDKPEYKMKLKDEDKDIKQPVAMAQRKTEVEAPSIPEERPTELVRHMSTDLQGPFPEDWNQKAKPPREAKKQLESKEKRHELKTSMESQITNRPSAIEPKRIGENEKSKWKTVQKAVSDKKESVIAEHMEGKSSVKKSSKASSNSKSVPLSQPAVETILAPVRSQQISEPSSKLEPGALSTLTVKSDTRTAASEQVKPEPLAKSKPNTKKSLQSPRPRSKSKSRPTKHKSSTKLSVVPATNKPGPKTKTNAELGDSLMTALRVVVDESGGDSQSGRSKKQQTTRPKKSDNSTNYTSFQSSMSKTTEYSVYPVETAPADQRSEGKSIDSGGVGDDTVPFSKTSHAEQVPGHQNQAQNMQQTMAANNNFDLLNYGVLPARTAAFRAPFVPLCEPGTEGSAHEVTLDEHGNVIDCDEEAGMNFSFKPRPNFATEVTFTVEPRKKPTWQTMMNCGFTPMIYCNVPPFCLPEERRQPQSYGYSPAGNSYNQANEALTSASSQSSEDSGSESGTDSQSSGEYEEEEEEEEE